jgi:hypothetical protein
MKSTKNQITRTKKEEPKNKSQKPNRKPGPGFKYCIHLDLEIWILLFGAWLLVFGIC